MNYPTAFSVAHMECYRLKETVPVLTDLLAFEVVSESSHETTLRHPNSHWLLSVHEGGANSPVKQMHNHYGVRVEKKSEVDAAYEYLTAHQKQYGLEQIGKPDISHGSYSLYFLEPGTNGWEIECFEDVLRKEVGGTRLGGVRSRHWDQPLNSDQFPGRGYVPQAFTHGTLASDNLEASKRFYTEVLGLEIFRAYDKVVYLKYPEHKSYIVSLAREGKKNYSDNFRFTVSMESQEAVLHTHDRLEGDGANLGVKELGDIQTREEVSCFLLRDPDFNCWEFSSKIYS